jgi:hypothetical protein
MKPLKVTPFGLGDLKLLAGSAELRPLSDLFKRILTSKQKKPFAVVVELPYSQRVWADCKANVEWPNDASLGDFVKADLSVIGFVTYRAMEIYEADRNGRKKSTAILLPGMSFGLFEAFASYKGDWTITSGIVSFLVCNPIGNDDKWTRAGANDIETAQFKFEKNSPLAFETLVSDDTCSSWTSQSVWIKPGLINDLTVRTEIEHLLQQKTINQLVSVTLQNPTWGRIGELDSPDEGLLFLQYLDSVIGGHTPILQLAADTDSFYLPLSEIKGRLRQYPGLTNVSPDILIPKKLQKDDRGIHPLNYVSRFPSKAADFIRMSARSIEDFGNKHRRDIEKIQTTGYWSVNYGSNAGKAKVSLINCSPPQEKKSTNDDEAEKTGSVPKNPTPHPLELLDGAKRAYTWDRLFNTVLIIEKLA